MDCAPKNLFASMGHQYTGIFSMVKRKILFFANVDISFLLHEDYNFSDVGDFVISR